MPPEASKTAASRSSSFASFLASLTAPKSQEDDLWKDAALDEDVSSISYEQALRTHARSRRPDLPPLPPLPPETPDATPDATSGPVPNPRLDPRHDPSARKPPHSVRITEWAPSEEASLLARNHKTASITIRLSQADCAQLHHRAADAGLTISAYLRSCIFEVESLRTQVKETLAQLRTGATAEPQSTQAPTPGHSVGTSPGGWRSRLFARRSRNRNLADA
jgi:hypothetical protein